MEQETLGKEFYESADKVIIIKKQETFLGKTISKKDADKDSFKDVTKYKIEKGYSEEEVEDIAKDAYAMGRKGILIGVFNKWFEQFKNK